MHIVSDKDDLVNCFQLDGKKNKGFVILLATKEKTIVLNENFCRMASAGHTELFGKQYDGMSLCCVPEFNSNGRTFIRSFHSAGRIPSELFANVYEGEHKGESFITRLTFNKFRNQLVFTKDKQESLRLRKE